MSYKQMGEGEDRGREREKEKYLPRFSSKHFTAEVQTLHFLLNSCIPFKLCQCESHNRTNLLCQLEMTAQVREATERLQEDGPLAAS